MVNFMSYIFYHNKKFLKKKKDRDWPQRSQAPLCHESHGQFQKKGTKPETTAYGHIFVEGRTGE